MQLSLALVVHPLDIEFTMAFRSGSPTTSATGTTYACIITVEATMGQTFLWCLELESRSAESQTVTERMNLPGTWLPPGLHLQVILKRA